VENKVNGLLSHDHKINRMDKELWRSTILSLHNAAAKVSDSPSAIATKNNGPEGQQNVFP
jgi:hypothetical protein